MALAADLSEDFAYLANAFYRLLINNAAPLLLATLTFLVVREHARKRNMPPGPPGLPFIGNKHQVPSIKPWRKFAEWSRLYGAFRDSDPARRACTARSRFLKLLRESYTQGRWSRCTLEVRQ